MSSPEALLSLLVLAFVLFASVALGVATAWALYRWTRRRWAWLLTPLFLLLWLLLGAAPFLFTWRSMAVPAPAPPAPIEIAPVEAADDIGR